MYSSIFTIYPFLISIGIGTPQEDAFRRDLTINALFYNLQEEVVEDFTGVSISAGLCNLFYFY